MKTYLTVGWTCRLLNYESNATWTDQIGVKTKKLWPKENSDKTVNRWKHILNLLKRNYVFWIRKCILELRYGLWVIHKKIAGALLQINQAKEYAKIWTVGSELDGLDYMGG